MKPPVFLMAAVALSLPLSTFAAELAPHDHGAAPTQIDLNAGKKWASDASLRTAMSTMRQQVKDALPAAHDGKLSAAQYQALGAALTRQIAYIVQNCKLEPKADGQLHAILGQLSGAIDAIEGKEGDAQRAAGVVKAAQALNAYGKYFEHAGWQPVTLAG